MILRRWWFRTALLAGLCFLLGFSYEYHLPKLESFLLIEVERFSREHAPVRIWAKKLHVHLLPVGVVLEDVRILPKAPVSRYLAPATLKQAGVRLSLLPLLRGEVRLAQAFVRDSELNLFLREDMFKDGTSRNAAKFDFDRIYRLPVDELVLERVKIQGRLTPQDVVFRFNDLNLTIENRYRSLFVELDAPTAEVKPSGPIKPLAVQLELRTLIEAREMQISAFKLKADQSFVVASGRFNGDFAAGRVDNGAFDARAKLQLADVNVWERVLRTERRIPRLDGRAEMNVGVEVRGGRGYHVEGELHTSDVQIDRFHVGKIDTRLSSNLSEILSDVIEIQNSAGAVRLNKFKLNLGETPAVAATVNVPRLEVGALLQNLGLRNVPILVDANGDVDCTGVMKPQPELKCAGKVGVKHLLVHGKSGRQEVIVEANDGRATGEVKVTPTDVEYSAEAEVGQNSRGRTKGVINYDTGFNITYEGDRVHFGDVKNLANLKLEGDAKIVGRTAGNAATATLELRAEARNVWLENYHLGQLGSRVSYRAGHLNFARVQGLLGTTQFAGGLDLDLPEHRLKLSLDVPFADLRDVADLFSRRVQLPVSATGTGQAHVEASGPLKFSDLSYTLKSDFFRGEIAGESFDELAFYVTSKNGLVKSDRIAFTKAAGHGEMRAQITPTGNINATLAARGLRLEQSENVARAGLDVQGQGDVDLNITGQLPRPSIELEGRLTKVVVADQPAADSKFHLGVRHDRVEGKGSFLGTTIQGDVIYPYADDAPFALNLKVDRWDFSELFAAVSRSARQLDFATSVSGRVALNAPRGGFWSSTGIIELTEFDLRKGAKRLAAKKPMRLTMTAGELNSSDFAISSEDNFLKLDVVGTRRERLNASLNGKLDASLLGLFTPFISDLRGNLAVSMDVRGKMSEPALRGSAYVDKGYVKLRDFAHPFANLRADLIFNDNQILLNSLRTELAGGRAAAEGRISFEVNERPLDVRGTFTDVSLNVPENFRTRGSGTMAISGRGFPYALEVKYGVTGGEISSDFTNTDSGLATVKASAYLPHFVAKDAFHPFIFNVDVNLRSPVVINNAIAQMSVGGSVIARGPPDRLLLNGTLTPLPGGKVFFNNQPFEVTSAYFEYNNSPPPNPKIYLVANTRVSSIDEDAQGRTKETPYEVNLLAQGRGPVPQIILSSQPSLTQREIVSLLALGVTSAARDDGKNNISSGAIGAALLQKAGGKRIKESLGVDVKVSSTQAAADAASTPKVTLSKQWTPNFGASASSTLQANPANNVKVEYKMNRSMSVIGSWDGREYDPIQKDPARNVFGLDLEYKKQFR